MKLRSAVTFQEQNRLLFTGELRRCQTHLVRLNGIQNVPLAHFAFTAQLRPDALRLQWVLSIAEGDLIGKTRYVRSLKGCEQ